MGTDVHAVESNPSIVFGRMGHGYSRPMGGDDVSRHPSEVHRREALARFERIISEAEAQTPMALVEPLVVISAAIQGLSLDIVDAVSAKLDAIAISVGSGDVAHIARRLFSEVNNGNPFVGNRLEYADPLNSFIDRVIERRRGIPISLSVVLIEVARRCGVEMVGVGMPAHFLTAVRPPSGARPEVFVDAFNHGRVLDAGDCERLFHELVGAVQTFDHRFLAPVSNSAIVERTLNNLKAAYMQQGDVDRLRVVMTMRACLPGMARAERDEFRRLMAPLN